MKKDADTTLPIHELIRGRWSPRAFEPRSLERETLELLFEAARWAASCFNEQPWRFLTARRDDPAGFELLLSTLGESNRRWAANAGALVIGVAKESFTRNDKPNRHARYDLGQAVATLALQAQSIGVVLHQMAGFDPQKVRALSEVPEGYEPLVAIALGYPAEPTSLPDDLQERERAPRTRKPQTDFVFGAHFSRAAE
ncbi:MAG: nitroreductase family protein [Myxococcales bacterium]|nr:nitroreductase family protein [Myxococcales bacterium]